jgi:TRAP-type transport system periplasmic protein
LEETVMKFLSRSVALALATSLGMSIASAATAAPREVRIASHVSELAPLHAQSQMFAAEVEKRLPGRFVFKLYPGGQLGKESALIDNVRLGSIEMINVASGVLDLDKKLGVFDLPWLFTDRAQVKRAMMGPLGKQVAERLEKTAGVVVIGIYENGFRHVMNSVRAIKEPGDLKGLKIRVAGGKFRQEVFANLGATPAKVSWAETFTAMQTGVVDGAESGIYGFYESKLYEVQKYLSLTSHVYTPSFLIASQKFFTSLTPEEQKAFREAGAAITAATYDKAAALEDKYLADMKAKVKVNEVDIPAFRKATQATYDSYVKSQGDDWIKLINAAR